GARDAGKQLRVAARVLDGFLDNVLTCEQDDHDERDDDDTSRAENGRPQRGGQVVPLPEPVKQDPRQVHQLTTRWPSGALVSSHSIWRSPVLSALNFVVTVCPALVSIGRS